MGKNKTILDNSFYGFWIAFLVVTIFILSVLFLNKNVKGSQSEAVQKLVYIDNQKKIITTESQDPVRALKDNGIEVFDEDLITTELILDPVTTGAVGEKITVKRAPVIRVFADNKMTSFRSWLKTIGDVLSEKKFPLGPKDKVEPLPSTMVSNGAYVTVTRINEVEEEKDITIPYSTTAQPDLWLAKGQTKVKQTGVNGIRKQIYKVRYTDGKETSRVLLSEATIQRPVPKIVVTGVKPTNDSYGRWPIIVAAATKYGIDPVGMYNVMYCESKGNQYSGQYGAYKGIFQWDGSFYSWAQKAGYGGADIFDVTAQAYTTAYRVSKNGWSAWGCKP